MVISHKYKFIFIKTYKTAGTSLEVFLSQHCGEEDLVTPIFPPIESHSAKNHQGLWNPLPEIIGNKGRNIRKTVTNLWYQNKFFNHIPATQVRQRVPRKVWDTYFKFCVERNPWEKTLSHYSMLNDRAGGKISLEEYFEKRNFCINHPQYCDLGGRLMVNKVVKYESLMDELGSIFQELGVPFNGSLGIKAKSEHRKDRRPYQEVLSFKQRDIIEKEFAKEIEMHGYVY